MDEKDFPELYYKRDGRSPWLGTPEEVLSKTDGIPLPPTQNELKELASPMIEPEDGASKIKPYEYEKLNARYLYLPDGLKSIGDYAFAGCIKLEYAVLPESVGYIGEGAFMHCASIENLDIPDGVKKILPYTFLGMRSLDMLSFTKSVTEIHLSAFLACKKLTYIVFYGSIKDWKKIRFIGDKDILRGIYVTCADDTTDKYGMDAWSKKMSDYIKSSDELDVLDGSRQRRSDEIMAELDEIVKRIIEDN